jgi:IclR family transcriptional regulator, pca regulon regulatory protein
VRKLNGHQNEAPLSVPSSRNADVDPKLPSKSTSSKSTGLESTGLESTGLEFGVRGLGPLGHGTESRPEPRPESRPESVPQASTYSNGGDNGERSGEFVQSLERGLSVLRVFSAKTPTLTLSETARIAGLTRATARRILHTFEALGYVRNDGRQFSLTPKVLDLGYAYLSSLQVGDIALPYMEALSEKVNESVSAAVLDGTDIVYIARVPTRKIMRLSLALGSRLPAVATSMGRVLLAGLSSIECSAILERASFSQFTERSVQTHDEMLSALSVVKSQGWALVDQEFEDGLRSIAAPLRDRTGRVVAALNIGTQAGIVSLKTLKNEMVPQLLDCASRISDQLAKR